ncbi:MAG: DUF4209 domain-containing protein [Dehalococcoidia bacterium]
MKIPPEVGDVLQRFDEVGDAFDVHILHSELARCIEREAVPEALVPGWWAEVAAFGFDMHPAPSGGPWKTYFQPLAIFVNQEGVQVCSPEIADATEETISHWSARSKEAKHPILVARYADLVWDFARVVTGNRPHVEFARLAIDSYVAALNMDKGEAWGDNYYNVNRVIQLAMSIKDGDRIATAAQAVIDYTERTGDDGKIGTYCYVFDLLVLPKKKPPLSDEQTSTIVHRFEERFSEMTKPDGRITVGPHAVRDIGIRLAKYYEREGRDDDRVRAISAVALRFEKHAEAADPIAAMFFLDDAHKLYLVAGRAEDSDRMLRVQQNLAPQVKGAMTRHSVEIDVAGDDFQEFLAKLTAGGVGAGFLRWALELLPRQETVLGQAEELATQYPLQAMFSPALVGDSGVEAKVDDTRGDPDGPAVYETSKYMSLMVPWISMSLDHLIAEGLSAESCIAQIAASPLFPEDRIILIRRGIEAHMLGDFVQSIHVLVPQIERALIELVRLLGGTSIKAHRTGRGVAQAKSLNDALSDETTRELLGQDVTIYLIAALSHPKGQNIRNKVCHGLWGPESFTKAVSERLLHVLAVLAHLRSSEAPEGEPPADDSESSTRGEGGVS